MCYVFYDFETSGTDLLDQILAFAFVQTTVAYQKQEQLVGLIKLTALQWPHPQAIATNKLSIETLQNTGIPEWEAAEKIHSFLQKRIDTHGRITLIGYNSAHFDWEFLNSLFIRHGLSPYFMGKISHVDLLYVMRHCYFQHYTTFALPHKTSSTGHRYVSMTLEAVSQALHILNTKQTHDALDDVHLCIALAQKIEAQWNVSPQTHRAHNLSHCQPWRIYRQKVLHFANSPQDIQPYVWKYWVPIAQEKNGGLALDLQWWADHEYTDPKDALKYSNQTRHDFWLEEVPDTEIPPPIQEAYQTAISTPELLTMSMSTYFETPLTWDIAYQLHALGFKRIDALRYHIRQLLKNPDDHTAIVTPLWQNRKDQKDYYLVQLLNRAYLAIHPNPKQEHLQKYIRARYIDGPMYRNPENKPNRESDIAWVENALQTCDANMQEILYPLLVYYREFLDIPIPK